MFARVVWTASRWLSKVSSETVSTVRPQKPKKLQKIPRITLIHQDKSISIVELEKAEELSANLRLKLVKIVDYDAQTRRPLYKLMTTSEYLQEDVKRRAEKKEAKKEFSIKGEKDLPINSTINEYDLDTKMRNLGKWLNKNHEVRVMISGSSRSDKPRLEKIFSRLTAELPPHVKIQQKAFSGNNLRCVIMPTKNSVEMDSTNSIQNDTNLQQKREMHTHSGGSREL